MAECPGERKAVLPEFRASFIRIVLGVVSVNDQIFPQAFKLLPQYEWVKEIGQLGGILIARFTPRESWGKLLANSQSVETVEKFANNCIVRVLEIFRLWKNCGKILGFSTSYLYLIAKSPLSTEGFILNGFS